MNVHTCTRIQRDELPCPSLDVHVQLTPKIYLIMRFRCASSLNITNFSGKYKSDTHLNLYLGSMVAVAAAALYTR